MSYSASAVFLAILLATASGSASAEAGLPSETRVRDTLQEPIQA